MYYGHIPLVVIILSRQTQQEVALKLTMNLQLVIE